MSHCSEPVIDSCKQACFLFQGGFYIIYQLDERAYGIKIKGAVLGEAALAR